MTDIFDTCSAVIGALLMLGSAVVMACGLWMMLVSKATRHMGRVAALGCILCRIQGRGQVDAEIHHLREGVGMSQRQSDYLTVPLCPACHRGSTGLHGDRSLLRISKLDELGLLAATLEELEQ